MLKANKTRDVFFYINTPVTALSVLSATFFVIAVRWGGYAQ